MMKMMMYPLLLAAAILLIAPYGQCESEPIRELATCAEGWTLYPQGRLCFSSMVAKKDWYDAEKACKEFPGGQMATIKDDATNKFVISILRRNQKTWIGLNDFNKEGQLRWFDETENAVYHHVTLAKNEKLADCVQIKSPGGTDLVWEMDTCLGRFDYLCQRPVEEDAAKLTRPVPLIQEVCREGWIRFKGGSGCIKEFPAATWIDAQATCQENDAHLLKINNFRANNFLTEAVSKNRNYWIGVNDRCEEGTWVNDVDGTPIVFESWNVNEPRTGRTADDMDCVVLTNYKRVIWTAKLCSYWAYFICQYGDTPRVTRTCETGWTQLSDDSRCVKKSTGKRATWKKASRVCKSLGGDLAMIKNQKDFAAIKGLAGASKKIWVGISKKTKNAQWKWAKDGSDILFTKWSKGQPTKKDTNLCAEMAMKKGGEWNDSKCMARRDYVCEKAADETTE